MASKSKSRTLTDHDEIRRWAEERDAKPATVRATHDANSTGIIRLDFPGYSGGDSLEEIEWDEWFQDFDDNNLALIVQDETANGEQSNFNKLVSRERTADYSSETADSEKKTSKRGTTSKRGAARKTKGQSSKKAAASGDKESARGASKRATTSSTSERQTGSGHKTRSSGRKAA
jgi:hypothetical protein